MAKKSNEVQGPVITSLPLPASDSALVIDLPDGQKLLVGKMPNGSVIEVATWRGTGRPDSRTNRLMLGMSSSDSQEQNEISEVENTSVNRGLSLGYAIYLLKNIYIFLNNFFVTALQRLKNLIPSKKSNSQPASSNSDESIEQWLEKITQNKIASLEKSSQKSSSATSAKKVAQSRKKSTSTSTKRESTATKRSKSPQKKSR